MNEQEEINKLLMEAGAFGVTSDSPSGTGEPEPVGDEPKIEGTDGIDGAAQKDSTQGNENDQEVKNGDEPENGSGESKDGTKGDGVSTEKGKKHEEAVPYERFNQVNVSYLATKEENEQLKKTIDDTKKDRDDVIDGLKELLKINDVEVETFEDIKPYIKDNPELMKKLEKAFPTGKGDNPEPAKSVAIDDTKAGEELILELVGVGFMEADEQSVKTFGKEIIERFGGKVADAKAFYSKVITSLNKAKETGKSEYSNELKKKTGRTHAPNPGTGPVTFTEKPPSEKDFTNKRDYIEAKDEYEIRKELAQFS